MAWTQKADLRGPQGAQGERGLQGLPGTPGADGKSVSIKGSVANAAALPTNLAPANAGDGYITQNDGHLHVWSGTAFNDVGTVRGPAGADGATGLQGPKGDPGAAGADGARGTRIFNGTGVPSAVAGAAPGDYYLDNSTGILYELS